MSASGVLAGKGYVQIGLDDKALYSGIKAMQGRMRSLGQQMSSVGAGLFGAGAAGLAPLIPAIMKASDAAEGYNRFLAVMGAEAKSTDAALEEMAKRIGRNQTELRDTASSFQGMFVGLGMTKSEAAKLATQMTELSLDFASFNNLADSDAQERFLAGLSGSGEVFDRFGINIKEAALKTKLAQMGIQGTATELQKTQARIAIITESMGRQGATRDATTTAGSFANQLKAIRAEADAAAEGIGKTLLPELTKYLPIVRDNVRSAGEWLKQNPQLIIQYAKLAAGVAAAGVALFTAGKALETTSALIGAGSTAVKVLTANWQAFGVVGAAAAIAAISYAIYQANSAVKEFNAELERGNRLADEITAKSSARFDSMELEVKSAKSLKEAEQLVQLAEREAAGARKRQEGAAQRIAEREKQLNESLALGMDAGLPGSGFLIRQSGTTLGNKTVEVLKAELDEMTKSADLASDRSQRMRKMLEQMKKAKAEEIAQVKQAEESRRAEIEKTRQAELLAEQQRQKILIAEKNRSEFEINDPRRRLVNPLWKTRQQMDQQFRQMQSSFVEIQSAAMARGLAGRVVTEKKAEDLLGDIATNTKATAEAIRNLPGLTLGT